MGVLCKSKQAARSRFGSGVAAEFQRSPALYMIVDEILAFWKSKGVIPRNPLTAAEIHDFELKHKINSPSAISKFYKATNGTECDHDLISFWPLEEIGNVPEKLSRSGGSPDYRNIVNTLPKPESF